MKNLIYLILFISFLSCERDNQETKLNDFQGLVVSSKTFGGSLDEKINSVVATNDGGYLVLGYTNSTDGDINKTHDLIDIWLSKYEANGNLVWSKTIGGSQNDYGTSIIKTNDGNFVIAGYSASNDGDIPANVGLHDFIISKINENGDILWTKNYGFTSHDHAHKIIQTKDGGFFIAGFADYSGISGSGNTGNHGEGHGLRSANNSNLKNSSKTLHGTGEFFGIKLNDKGEFKWYRYFGGTQNDRISDVVEANDGGILLVGFSESVDFDIVDNKGSYDYWIVKLESDGHLHWKENYGGSGTDQAFSVVKTANNSYLIVGKSNSTNGQIKNPKGGFDAWMIHINEHGHLLWEKSFGGSEFDVANTIKQLPNGNFGIVGNSRSSLENNLCKGENDYWFFEIDNQPNSKVIWQKTFGGSKIDNATDFMMNANNELILFGESQSNNEDVPNNRGSNDLWVLKLK